MKNAKNYKSPISGHLDIQIAKYEADKDDQALGLEDWNEILIHGDPEGLRSLAKALLQLADVDQETMDELPAGAREHIHLRPNLELAGSSEQVVVGRLDAKGTGNFYDSYIPKRNGD